MKYRWIENIKGFLDISGEWDNSVISSGDNNPFLLSDFITIWWKHYSKGRRLLIFVASKGKDIVGGIPLCIEKKFMRNTAVHIGAQAANLTHFFVRDKTVNIVEPFIESLVRRSDLDGLILNRVSVRHFLVEQLKNICWKDYKNLRLSESNAGFNGTIDLTEGYERVFRRLNNRLRKYIGNGKKEAEKWGGLKLLKIKGGSEVRRLFSEYITLSVSSFKERKLISAFEDSTYSSFFGELLEVFDKRGLLDAHKLIAGPHTFGISFGYRLGIGFKWILTAYNPAFSRLRPGHLLIDALVQEAIKNKDHYFDMYYGGEALYKQQWCDQMVPLKKIEIYRKNLFNTSFIKAEKIVRSSPLLLNTSRRIITVFKKIR